MNKSNPRRGATRFLISILAVVPAIAAILVLEGYQWSRGATIPTASYADGVLHLTIPYHADRDGAGRLTLEVLDPEDNVVGRAEREVDAAKGEGGWQGEIKLDSKLPLDDLVWHRVFYRFEFDDHKTAGWEGIESISQILQRPVMHILAQQSYLPGGWAAVRVIVTDSKNDMIGGVASVRIEFLVADEKPRMLFKGQLKERGTTEAQFRFPTGLVGNFQLHYLVDTPIGSTEFTQAVRLEEKVSILLTTEKPIYQPGQTIHVRALALDRSDHEAAARHKLTFEIEDSRGNKVFRDATETDEFGIASAEFGLADEVNLGAYHLRALMGDAEAPVNSAEIAINVERYVLPKFKVAVEFSAVGAKQKRGYQPGDHVTGTVRANYFFGKPVGGAEITMKATAMDVKAAEVASAQGWMESDGTYHFDLPLPNFFAGRPLSHGAAPVLIEATVKDSAGHAESRGEPITVSESPLLITAVPEGGTLVPNLENQVFILTSYPDGTAAKTDLIVHADGKVVQHLTTDGGGIAIAHIKAGAGKESLKIEAADQEGNHASSQIQLESRGGDEQILLRTDRAMYRAGDPIQLKVFSTKLSGAAYVDIVKEGQTVLTRDLDLENGQAELLLTAPPNLAGTVDINAYLFGRDARPVGDHRLIFVQPAEDLKIETVADAAVYKPGGEAQIRFRVTDSHGAGIHAALGLQVVDEAVFALAEKQPGFAKVFFYLEQEVMKPRYEIHSIGMPEIVEPVENSQFEQRARAARALFSATEIVNQNKFETEIGRDVPMTKQAEYEGRYKARFFEQVSRLARNFNIDVGENSATAALIKAFTRMKNSGGPDLRDAWGNELRFEPSPGYQAMTFFVVRSAGPDRQFDTADDLTMYVGEHTSRPVSEGVSRGVGEIKIEHNFGLFNGLAEIVGTVTDQSGAVVPGAEVKVREFSERKTRDTKTDASGHFSMMGLLAGNYEVRTFSQGFRTSLWQFALLPRDRAVLSVVLEVGQVTQTVEVSAAAPELMTENASR